MNNLGNNIKLERLISRLDESSYICIKGKYWDNLWKMLPSYKEVQKPLVLSGWHYSDDKEKKERFILHLTIADENGILEKVVKYLDSLPEAAWYISDGSKKPI